MGQSSLIMVLGAAFLIGFMGVRMQEGSSNAMQNSVSYYNKTYARNIATSAVEIYLKKLKDDINIRGNRTISDIMDGKANIRISAWGTGSVDTLLMRTEGIYNRDTVRIANILSSVTSPLNQKFDGAAGVTYGKRAVISLKNNTILDGRNHDLNGNLDTLYAPAVAGLILGTAANAGDLTTESSVLIKGKGSVEPNIEVGGAQVDRTEWIEKLKSLADITISLKGDLNDTKQFGTVGIPKITYVKDFKGTTNFKKDVSGAGILIVEGDAKFSKDFSFTGLVIVLGDGNMETAKFNSTSKIVGALMVVGGNEANKTKLTLNGNANILYSKKAVAFAESKATDEVIARYEISEWFE